MIRNPKSVRRAFGRSAWNLAGLGVIAALALVAILADFIASDRPIWLKHRGEHYAFPNLIDYPELRILRNDALRRVMVKGEDWAIMPLVPHGPLQSKIDGEIRPLVPPCAKHWLGTDDRGRDVLARMIHGTRVSLSVGFVAVALMVLLGTMLGAAAGFRGGWVDSLVTRVTEMLMAFPAFFFILIVQGLLPTASLLQVMAVIGLVQWTGVARLVRGEVLRLRSAEFVLAARALGIPPRRVLFRHVLPNAMGPVLVSATFGVGNAILIESALSFLGFGSPPPTASWGELLTQAFSHGGKWWLTVFPGLAIFATVTAYNLVGEGIRDATDPRTARAGSPPV
ncbi:MAG: ABC transporter permease [Myxococcota bacterium]|nr:ABC transporter permease [Myxococcota bacterium]